MTRSADLQPDEAELETGLVTLRGSQLATRTSASAATRAPSRRSARSPAAEPAAHMDPSDAHSGVLNDSDHHGMAGSEFTRSAGRWFGLFDLTTRLRAAGLDEPGR